MPTHEAQLILSCKATGTAEIKKFKHSIVETDTSSKELKKTIAGIFSSAAFYKLGKDSIRLFMTQQAAVEGLNTALKVQGAAYHTLTPELMAFNAEIQNQTVYGDEQIAMIQAQGLNMGITADKIKDATKAAIGLAAAYNMQLRSAMMLIARASQGQTQMLSRYGIVLGENLTPQEKYAKLLELGASKIEIAKEKTKTLQGALQQMNNAVNDAKESVGGVFAPTLTTLAHTATSAAQGFQQIPEPIRNVIVMTGTLTAGMTALRTAINLKTIAEQIATGTTLAHSGAMAETGRTAEIQKKHMAELMEYSARLNALDIERAGLVKGVADADKDRLQVYQKFEAADRKVAEAAENVNQAMRGFAEARAAWVQDTEDAFLMEDAIFQRDQLNKYNAELIAAKKNVAELENVYGDLNDSWKQATDNLTAFDDARKKEKDYTNSLEETKAAIAARNKALEEGKSSLDADNEAIQAYNNSLAEQSEKAKITAEAEMRRVQALKMGATEAEANRVKTEFLAKAQQKNAVASSTWSRGIKAVGVAARTAGVAIKSMMISALPMLALSLAIEGVMWLVNRRSEQNKASLDIAQKETEQVKKQIDEQKKLRDLDNDKIRRYEELTKLTDRTEEEQNELVRITGELNKGYNGLNAPLLKQNETLEDTAKLWETIKKKQKEQQEQELLMLSERQKREVEIARISAEHELYAGWYNFSDNNKYALDAALRSKDPVNKLKILYKSLVKDGNEDDAKAVNNLISAYEKLAVVQNKYNDLVSGKTEQTEKNKEDRKLADERRKLADKYNEKLKRDQFDQMDIQSKIASKEKDLAEYRKQEQYYSQRDKTSENVKKLYEFKTKILDTEKELRNLREQSAEALKQENDEIIRQAKELEDKKLQKAREVYDALQQQKQAQVSIWQELYNAGRSYRETAQSAVMTSSEQAIRMQSRVLFAPKLNTAEQAQKQTAVTAAEIRKILDDWKQKSDSLNTDVQTIARNLQVTDYQ